MHERMEKQEETVQEYKQMVLDGQLLGKAEAMVLAQMPLEALCAAADEICRSPAGSNCAPMSQWNSGARLFYHCIAPAPIMLLSHRIDLALTLRELGIKSVPVNLLNPIAGTPYAQNEYLQKWPH